MALFDQFKTEYESQIKGHVSALCGLVDESVLESWYPSVHNNPAAIAETIDKLSNRELAFAERVLTFLEEVPEERRIYWDLDETILSHVSSDEGEGNVVRPVAPFLMRFLECKGYEHGIYTAQSEEVLAKRVQNPNKFHSVVPYLTLSLIISSRDTTARVKEEKGACTKAGAFLHDVQRGVLIDDGYATNHLYPIEKEPEANCRATFDFPIQPYYPIKRGICVDQVDTIHVNRLGRYIGGRKIKELFGEGI